MGRIRISHKVNANGEDIIVFRKGEGSLSFVVHKENDERSTETETELSKPSRQGSLDDFLKRQEDRNRD